MPVSLLRVSLMPKGQKNEKYLRAENRCDKRGTIFCFLGDIQRSTVAENRFLAITKF